MENEEEKSTLLKYSSEEELQKGIDKYFKDCDKKCLPYTMTGLADALDIDRKTLYRYGNREDYAPLIKKAKRRVERQLEENGLMGKSNPTFTIFNLKNNFGWRDSVEVNNETELTKLDELLQGIRKDANN